MGRRAADGRGRSSSLRPCRLRAREVSPAKCSREDGRRLRSWLPSTTSKVTPRPASQAPSRRTSLERSTAGARRLDQVARHDQVSRFRAVEHECEACQGLIQRVGDHTVARRASGPFVSQMKVGDHGGSLAGVDRRSFGRELPALEQVDAAFCVGGHAHRSGPRELIASRACRRRSATAGGSKQRASAGPGSIQAAAKGESPGSTRNRTAGR